MHLSDDIDFDDLEIRQYYLNYSGGKRKKFDLEFAAQANSYDLVIFGGGNFFEIWLENSATGCTLDIAPEVIRSLRTKTLFFGLGFDRYKGYSDGTMQKFLQFIKSVQDRERFFITVRNDGSLEQMLESFGREAAQWVQKVPDGGFFIDPDQDYPCLADKGSYRIVISLARDMSSIRYGEKNAAEGHANLVAAIVEYISRAAEQIPNVFFLFMPHVYSDVSAIAEVLQLLPDHIRRNQVAMGPCLSGVRAVDPVFANYRSADIVIGMRFHANVCSIGMGVPTIGIGTYRKIDDLYRELGLERRLVNGRNLPMTEKLLDLTMDIYQHRSAYELENRSVMERVNREMTEFTRRFTRFMHRR